MGSTDIDFRWVTVVLRELEENLDRLRDVEIADLTATAFGLWAFLVALGLADHYNHVFTSIVPGLLVFIGSGINVYRTRHGYSGFEAANQASILLALWMILSAGFLIDPSLLQYSTTFAGMWIGIASAYAAFLRQNDRRRETLLMWQRGMY